MIKRNPVLKKTGFLCFKYECIENINLPLVINVLKSV